jgi:hypothetical protein
MSGREKEGVMSAPLGFMQSGTTSSAMWATRGRAALLVPKSEVKEEENEVTTLLRQQPRNDNEADPSGAVKDGPADWD